MRWMDEVRGSDTLPGRQTVKGTLLTPSTAACSSSHAVFRSSSAPDMRSNAPVCGHSLNTGTEDAIASVYPD